MNTRDLRDIARARTLVMSGEAARIRERSGVSLAEIAKTIGVSKAAVRNYENRIRAPRGRTAVRYVRALDALAAEATVKEFRDDAR